LEVDEKMNSFFVSLFQVCPINVLKRVSAFFSLSFAKLIAEVHRMNETLKDVHHKQLLTYLKLTNKKLGLLINFNIVSLKFGIVRIVNNL
jgi:GxxExxY protein